MEYHLYPPFFEITPEITFGDAWESFCCQMLNLRNKTNEIRRRTPPDMGIDLWWPSEHRAYQCKSVEGGLAGKFPLQSAIESLKTALKIKKKLGWKEYFICTNVNITGSQEQKIREVYPEVKFCTQDFWLSCCSEYPQIVAPRFRLLVRIEEPAVLMSINKIFLQDYAKNLASSLAKNPLPLLVYSNRRKEIFRVPFSPDFTVDDVLEILIKIFQLPTARNYEIEEVSVSLSYKLVINNSSVPLDKKLSELGLVNDSVVTCWTTIVWQDNRENTHADATRMEMMTIEGAMKGMRSSEERGAAAIHKFKNEIDRAFDASLKQLAVLHKSTGGAE